MTLVVTRHPALVDYLRRHGCIGDDVEVREHVTADDVRDRHVIGVLPMHLAALAASVTEVPLALTPDMRGRELTLEELERVAGRPRRYRVLEVDTVRGLAEELGVPEDEVLRVARRAAWADGYEIGDDGELPRAVAAAVRRELGGEER